MRGGLLLVGLAWAAMPATVSAQTAPHDPVPTLAIDAETGRKLSWAIERGSLLFGIDRAAWVATDDMQARIPEAQRGGLSGYVVDREPGGFVVLFFAHEGGRLVAGYRGHVREGGVAGREIFAAGQRPPLSPIQARMATAIQQMQAAGPRLDMCSASRPNLAVIPPDTADGPVDIYVMTPQTEAGTVPLGGHHRLTIDRTGRIVAQRKFLNSCLPLAVRQPGQGNPISNVVGHMLDPIPTEIHVFSALATDLPLFVDAGGKLWELSGARIRLLDRASLESPRNAH